MSAGTPDVPDKLAPAATPGGPILLSPWLAFPAAGFCFIAGGFRLTADDAFAYESLNLELPWPLEWQLEWGAWLALAFVVTGLVFLLLTRWLPRRGANAFRDLATCASIAAALVSLFVLVSGEMIFFKLQSSLQQ